MVLCLHRAHQESCISVAREEGEGLWGCGGFGVAHGTWQSGSAVLPHTDGKPRVFLNSMVSQGAPEEL